MVPVSASASTSVIDCESNIPTIDFAPFWKDEGVVIGENPTEEQKRMAKEIDSACRCYGFVLLQNFISKELREKAFNGSKDLFGLTEKDAKLKRISPETNMGFAPYKSESLNRQRPPEIKEAFNVRFLPAHSNDLTNCPESFVEAAELLLAHFREAARRYGLACSLALGLSCGFFASTLKNMDLCTVRFLHAPPCDFTETSVGVEKAIRVGGKCKNRDHFSLSSKTALKKVFLYHRYARAH